MKSKEERMLEICEKLEAANKVVEAVIAEMFALIDEEKSNHIINQL